MLAFFIMTWWVTGMVWLRSYHYSFGVFVFVVGSKSLRIVGCSYIRTRKPKPHLLVN